MLSSSFMAGVPLTLGADEEEVFIAIVAIVGAIIIIHVVLSNIRRMYQTRQREATRREIAAYVAEGSIAPDARPS